MARVPSRGSDQFVVRFPVGMRDQLKELAAMNGRSLNAEIIDRLTTSIEQWPRITLPRDLYEVAVHLPIGILFPLEEEIQRFAVSRVKKAVHDHSLSQSNLMSMLQEAINAASDEERSHLLQEIKTLLLRAEVSLPDED